MAMCNIQISDKDRATFWEDKINEMFENEIAITFDEGYDITVYSISKKAYYRGIYDEHIDFGDLTKIISRTIDQLEISNYPRVFVNGKEQL